MLILDSLGILAIIAAVLVITAHSPVVSIMYLISVFIISACYLICLGVNFVGLIYLVVYVGAVAVLFMFVVMMLNVRLSEVVAAGNEYTKNLPLALIIGSVFMYIMQASDYGFNTRTGELAINLLNVLHNNLLGLHLYFTTPLADVSYFNVSQVQALGFNLYTNGALWLMIVSIVLLLAMIGPIALCLRRI